MDSNEESDIVKRATEKKFQEAKKNREAIPQKGVFANINEEWADYDLKQWNLFVNGSFTGNRLTEYKGRKCAITSQHYELIPNEKVTEIA